MANDVPEYLGIRPRFVGGTQVGGCSFILHVEHAMAAIHAGLCEVALITHGGVGLLAHRHAGAALGRRLDEQPVRAGAGAPPDRRPATAFSPPATCTNTARPRSRWPRWRWRRASGRRSTPRRMPRDPLTIDDVLNSRLISWPFNLLDCCLVTDAGGACVVTSAARARDLPKPPVYVLGTGECATHQMVSQMPAFDRWDAARGVRRARLRDVRRRTRRHRRRASSTTPSPSCRSSRSKRSASASAARAAPSSAASAPHPAAPSR